jgi:transcriptional regulator with XRE-family HTH domain
MHVIAGEIGGAYRGGMASRPMSKPSRAATGPAPNRIRELAERAKVTYDDLAAHFGVHKVTIANLARGKARGGSDLTQEWMEKLGAFFGVPTEEIIAKPLVDGLRRVTVTGELAAGAWHEGFNYAAEDQFEVLIPDDENLRRIRLYAAKVQGNSMNLRYPQGSVVVLSYVGDRPSDVGVGGRYHVKRTRVDGKAEDTIKTLVKDAEGQFWLKPESTDPQFQEWIPLDGKAGEQVELIGRVRYAVQREE